MEQIPQDLLDLLADPETHTPLVLADSDRLDRLREAVRSGEARRRDGQPASTDFEGALLGQDDRVAYLIKGGIPNLLLEERLELTRVL